MSRSMEPRRSRQQLREDALAIWRAGIDAVLGDRLVLDWMQADEESLRVGDDSVRPADFRRIVVVGGGKAGSAMAVGLEQVLAPWSATVSMQGWLNVPEGTVRETQWIHLHQARPAGRNEPTQAGVEGTAKMLSWVDELTPDDWCIVLLSGGGSALMPAPVEGVSLADKQAVTRFLSGAGANIEELNTVRKSLSQIKGGGLLRRCQAGRLDTLIISDVLGDPLDVIASGPTVDNTTSPQDALEVLGRFDPREDDCPNSVYRVLRESLSNPGAASAQRSGPVVSTNHVIGNLAVAVDAAGIEAEKRGYSHAMDCARELEGEAETVGRNHARLAVRMRDQQGPDCLITGGEPTVTLAAPEIRGRGGRNQQLVLAAWDQLRSESSQGLNPCHGICLLSGGSDGEDGPTDAAGAWIDEEVSEAIGERGLDTAAALARNDAYPLFAAAGGLLVTGPTQTNVCDLRVVVVDRIETPQ